jgi:cellulose synthase/poly-beta-1,6-N-acetylglucosamine synthase-like glycosyltransferase
MTEVYLPSITIVIPTLNEERFIGRCLSALADLEYPPEKLDVRVVDNYSQDQTEKLALKLGAHVIRAERKTVAYSRNVGALGVSTELIAFLDADCLPSRMWLANAVTHFETTTVAAVGSYPSVLENESNTLQKTWATLCSQNGEGVHNVNWLPTANFIVRASYFEDIGGFNESLTTCEDVDLAYRLRACGAILYDPEVLVYHLREPSTIKEFIKKEFWHAESNITGFLSHGMRITEIPSLAAPLVFGTGMAVGSAGVATGKLFLLFGFALSLAIPAAYTVRAYKKAISLPIVFIIYNAYFSARFLAMLREVWRLLLMRSKAQATDASSEVK